MRFSGYRKVLYTFRSKGTPPFKEGAGSTQNHSRQVQTSLKMIFILVLGVYFFGLRINYITYVIGIRGQQKAGEPVQKYFGSTRRPL